MHVLMRASGTIVTTVKGIGIRVSASTSCGRDRRSPAPPGPGQALLSLRGHATESREAGSHHPEPSHKGLPEGSGVIFLVPFEGSQQ